MIEIDNDVYAALQTLGKDLVMELAQGLARARKLHPVFADCPAEASAAVYNEACELVASVHDKESVDRQHAEALDTAVTAIRYMGIEWLPKFGDTRLAETSEEYFRRLSQVLDEDAPESRSELSEHIVWCEDGAANDPVNHPPHYTAYPVEVIDMIRKVLGYEGFKAYCLGNEIKYRMRAGLKGDAAEDLAKAMKYKEFRDATV